MNDKDILLLSATYPINTGPIAPPTGDIIKKEEARLVLFPNPFKDMAKIVGNMMASNTYTKNKATNEIFPKLQTIRKVARAHRMKALLPHHGHSSIHRPPHN